MNNQLDFSKLYHQLRGKKISSKQNCLSNFFECARKYFQNIIEVLSPPHMEIALRLRRSNNRNSNNMTVLTTCIVIYACY